MIDAIGRNIHYLRISVTDRCNLRCRYCMPDEGVEQLDHAQVLTLEEIARLCRIFASLGVDRFKVTGGEPLVRKGIVDWIAELKQIPGIRQVTMTSNGVALAPCVDRLAAIGLDGINISLDTLDPESFRELTGFDALDKVLAGLDAAVESGIPVKVNCVPIAGVNGAQLAELAVLARDKVRAVRFIELMPIGLGQCFEGISSQEVLGLLGEAFGGLEPCADKLGNGPAEYWSAPGFKGKIGLIHAVSAHFCSLCNRVRLTADGQLKLCLAHDVGVDLMQPLRGGADDKMLTALILEGLTHKPAMHAFGTAPAGARRMNAIGG